MPLLYLWIAAQYLAMAIDADWFKTMVKPC